MTEAQLRLKVVGAMQGWIGCKEADGSHKKIIDLYNSHKPLARSYTVKYTDAWCATSASAAAIQAELTDIIPTECGCGQMIQLFMNMGRWQENDAYIPSPGDYIFYDWQDNGAGDNTGWPDHVGVVEKVTGSTITVIEGNNGDAVARRNIAVNGRYIRGFGVPNYASKATAEEVANTSGSLKIGDTVRFKGSKQYTSSYSSARAVNASACSAKVTAINTKGAYAYHLVGDGVYGWVKASDIEGVSSSSTIGVGDSVEFSGNIHYGSSYANAKGTACKGGTAKVTAINKIGAHPYHLVHSGKGCTVYGWVNANQVSK